MVTRYRKKHQSLPRGVQLANKLCKAGLSSVITPFLMSNEVVANQRKRAATTIQMAAARLVSAVDKQTTTSEDNDKSTIHLRSTILTI